MKVSSVIKKPLISEKNNFLVSQNVYAFEVSLKATKPLIKKIIEKSFRTKVKKVRTLICRKLYKANRFGVKKVRYWKKALVKLKTGEKISIFERT